MRRSIHSISSIIFWSTLQEHSIDRWEPPQSVTPAILDDGQLGLTIGSSGQFALNDWSFGQLCGLSRVDKQTINRLQTQTALQAFRDTLPQGRKPLQVLTTDDRVRSVHGVSYTRLFNPELLDMVRDHAGDFTPPEGFQRSHGLVCRRTGHVLFPD